VSEICTTKRLLIHYFSNVGNVYHKCENHDEQVEILDSMVFLNWRSRLDGGGSLKLPSAWTHPLDLKSRRVIAFPVHVDVPKHWTLGIAVNTSYRSQKPGDPPADNATANWHLFHFDSHPCQPQSRTFARGFTRWALELPESQALAETEVPVPRQPGDSNDCGLYPAQFLMCFLADMDNYIQHCITVSDLYLNFISS
jgi:hypothetical protein